jgi:hypothetical protein
VITITAIIAATAAAAAATAVGVNTATIPAEFPLPDHITCSIST